MPSVEMEALALSRRIVGIDAQQCAGDLGKGNVKLHLEAGRRSGVDVDVIDDGGVANIVGVFGMKV